MSRYSFPLILKIVYLPTPYSDGMSRRRAFREVQSALFAIRYQTSSGPAKSPCSSAAVNNFFRLITCKGNRTSSLPYTVLREMRTCKGIYSQNANCFVFCRSPEQAAMLDRTLG